MKAPEKLYFFEGEPILSARSKNVEGAYIEYVSIDAFIKKAKKWFKEQNEWYDMNGIRHYDTSDFEDFLKAMEL